MLNINDVRKYAENHNVLESAEHFCVNYNTLIRYAKKHGIKFRKTVKGTDMTKEELKKYSLEHTVKEIAENFNFTENHTRSILNSYGFRWKIERKPNGEKGDRNEMILYLSQKFSYESIVNVFGITKQRVEQINKSYGDR